MLVDIALIIHAQKKDGVNNRRVAELIALYQSCSKSQYPGSRGLALRYELELRQIVGPVSAGMVNRPRAIALNDSRAY
jgi:hypothetical protein